MPNAIRFGYMQVKLKKIMNTFIIVPVWDFFGLSKKLYTENISNWTQEDEWLISGNLAISHITINPVDSSVIDRNLKYKLY